MDFAAKVYHGQEGVGEMSGFEIRSKRDYHLDGVDVESNPKAGSNSEEGTRFTICL